MTFALLVRRVHLYLGAFFLSWIVMFALSSLILNHPGPFGIGGEGGAPQARWNTLVDRPYDLAVPTGADLRAIGATILSDAGLSASGGFGVGRPNPNRINVNLPNFQRPIRVAYLINERRLLAEQREFLWSPILTGMHTRNGYNLRAPRQTIWALLVDATCVTILFWIASGLYMWWLLPSTRRWGWLAIGAGAASFAVLMLAL